MHPRPERSALVWLAAGVILVATLTWLRLSTGVAKAFTSFDGTRIVYAQDGDGPAVVLLHAFMLNAETNWVATGITPALADAGYRVIWYDARGHGDSQAPVSAERYANRAMARDVGALLDHLAIERAVLVGYSMGSNVAIQAAGADPRIRGLILGGTNLGESEPWDATTRAAEVAGLRAADPPAGAFYRKLADELGGDRLAYAARLEGDEFPQFTQSEASALRVPACFVSGVKDADPTSLAELASTHRVKRVEGDHASAIWAPAFAQNILECLAFVAEKG